MTPQPCIAPAAEDGDCWRACIATILDLPVADLPNFAHNADWNGMLEAARRWLKPKGLSIYQTYCAGSWDLKEIISSFSERSPGAPFILCGASKRDPNDDHAVVVMDGALVHDPSGSGLSGPCQEVHGERWWYMHVICLSG